MATLATLGILLAAASATWWLLRSASGASAPAPAASAHCPVCGGHSVRLAGGRQRRCGSCGAEFLPRRRFTPPAPPAAGTVLLLLAFVAVAGFALSDLLMSWRLLGDGRAVLSAIAATVAAVAAGRHLLVRRGETQGN